MESRLRPSAAPPRRCLHEFQREELDPGRGGVGGRGRRPGSRTAARVGCGVRAGGCGRGCGGKGEDRLGWADFADPRRIEHPHGVEELDPGQGGLGRPGGARVGSCTRPRVRGEWCGWGRVQKCTGGHCSEASRPLRGLFRRPPCNPPPLCGGRGARGSKCAGLGAAGWHLHARRGEVEHLGSLPVEVRVCHSLYSTPEPNRCSVNVKKLYSHTFVAQKLIKSPRKSLRIWNGRLAPDRLPHISSRGLRLVIETR